MEQNASNIIDVHLKDASPMATVEKIRAIVAALGFTTKERWFESGTPYCYSNQISIPGTTFYTNGKGLTRELALASGYGELIERLQVGFIYGPTPLKDEDFLLQDDRYQMMPVQELLQKHRHWYQQVADMLADSTGEVLTPEQLLRRFTTKDGMISVAPFLDLHTHEKVWFPRLLWKLAYSSNGCAAGNSPEEALVQAISEIVERNHMIRIVKHGLALPDIPETELEKYPVSYEIIQYIRDNGYKVFIKDASLGTGFPVVCACFIDRRTGRYHTHFGAHPVLEIALERSLTESFQGRHIDQLTANEDFAPKRDVKFAFNDFFTELRQSSGNKLPSFFADDSSFAFDPAMGMDCFDNKKLLIWCKDYFRRLGYPLLITDFSCLGFPTYQILSPGYSEAYINRISQKTDDQLYAPYASAALKDLSKADEQLTLGFLMHMNKLKTLDSSFRTLFDFSLLTKIPAWIDTPKQRKLTAASTGYAYIRLGQYGHAASSVAKMIPYASQQELDELICLKRYLTMKHEGYDQGYIEKVLALFHEQTAKKLLDALSQGRHPLESYILHCDKAHCEDCILKDECCLKRVDALAMILEEHMEKLDFDTMAAHMKTIG